MKLLAIDTATEACSAALLYGASLLTRYEEPGRAHAERILPMVDEILAESGVSLASLDAIAFGRGPGAFTGLRIAAGVVQGLAFGADLPVLPVSNLAALAERAFLETAASAVLVCIDARMAEVYCCAYRRSADAAQGLGPERVMSPSQVQISPSSAEGGAWFGAGTGFGAYPQLGSRLGLLPSNIDGAMLSRAQEIARIGARDWAAGRALPAEEALPVYLRDQVAVMPRP